MHIAIVQLHSHVYHSSVARNMTCVTMVSVIHIRVITTTVSCIWKVVEPPEAMHIKVVES